jgi:hypothetical protein
MTPPSLSGERQSRYVKELFTVPPLIRDCINVKSLPTFFFVGNHAFHRLPASPATIYRRRFSDKKTKMKGGLITIKVLLSD